MMRRRLAHRTGEGWLADSLVYGTLDVAGSTSTMWPGRLRIVLTGRRTTAIANCGWTGGAWMLLWTHLKIIQGR